MVGVGGIQTLQFLEGEDLEVRDCGLFRTPGASLGSVSLCVKNEVKRADIIIPALRAFVEQSRVLLASTDRMVSKSKLNEDLSQKTSIFGLKLWVVVGIGVGALIVVMLFILTVWLAFRRRAKKPHDKLPSVMIPNDSKEIKEVKVDRVGNTYLAPPDGVLLPITETSGEKESSDKTVVHVGAGDIIYPALRPTPEPSKGNGKLRFPEVTPDKLLQLRSEADGISESDSVIRDHDTEERSTADSSRVTSGSHDGDRRGLVPAEHGDKASVRSADVRSTGSPSSEVAQLSWGNWYSFGDLEAATEGFSQLNVLGEGGYGIVFRGRLNDGVYIAVKSLLNNRWRKLFFIWGCSI